MIIMQAAIAFFSVFISHLHYLYTFTSSVSNKSFLFINLRFPREYLDLSDQRWCHFVQGISTSWLTANSCVNEAMLTDGHFIR